MKKQILSLVGLSVFFIWVLIAFFIYRDTKRELEIVLDSQLKQAAKVLLEEGSHELTEIKDAKNKGYNFDDTSDDIGEEHYLSFQMWDHRGVLILRSSNTIPETPLTNILSGFDTQRINNEDWRIFAMWTQSKDLQVQVAQKIDTRLGITKNFRSRLLFPIFLFLPILLLFVFFAIEKSLKPISNLSTEIKNRGPKDLNQLDGSKYPVEFSTIVSELNHLFQSLMIAIENEKRLTADAAHELRTPLAALKVQTQVALDTTELNLKNNSLLKINEVIDGLSRRVSQLLILAKLDSEAFQLEKSNCDLNLILKNEIALLTPKILEKNINIFFEDQSCFLYGYPDLLAVLSRNLIENSIRHTPLNGEIKITLEKSVGDSNTEIHNLNSNKVIALKVVDTGPGINAVDIPHLFERFYQAKGSNKDGSGLGLSIVKKIAELHQAQLFIKNQETPNTGLVVDVKFTS